MRFLVAFQLEQRRGEVVQCFPVPRLDLDGEFVLPACRRNVPQLAQRMATEQPQRKRRMADRAGCPMPGSSNRRRPGSARAGTTQCRGPHAPGRCRDRSQALPRRWRSPCQPGLLCGATPRSCAATSDRRGATPAPGAGTVPLPGHVPVGPAGHPWPTMSQRCRVLQRLRAPSAPRLPPRAQVPRRTGPCRG